MSNIFFLFKHFKVYGSEVSMYTYISYIRVQILRNENFFLETSSIVNLN